MGKRDLHVHFWVPASYGIHQGASYADERKDVSSSLSLSMSFAYSQFVIMSPSEKKQVCRNHMTRTMQRISLS